MNIDRVLIPFGPDRTLNEIAASMLTCESPDEAIRKGLIEDPWHGYASWTQRTPSIVAWDAINASPIECSIRIVRACATKLHLSHLHDDLADPLRTAIEQGPERGDRFLRVRNLVKLFHDDRAAVELEMLHALDAFGYWLPEIGELIERLGKGGLIAMFQQADRDRRSDADHHAAFAEAGEQGADEVSGARLEAMLLSMRADRRERVLTEIAFAEPTFASLVQRQLPRKSRRAVRAVSSRRVAQA